jgi:glyoxylase-like metal-dependent hydrolase (beta-lactamase superfamily II)
MTKDGLSGSDIGLVILSHSHPDHSEAAVALRNEYRSLVAIHPADEPDYSRTGGKADLFLEEGTLELGKTALLHIYHSPGHTPGHITIYWPEHHVLIAGDCIFYRSTGRTDFPGGNARSLGETIKKLAKLEVEYLLCGHAYGNSGIITGKEEVRENFRSIGALLY